MITCLGRPGRRFGSDAELGVVIARMETPGFPRRRDVAAAAAADNASG